MDALYQRLLNFTHDGIFRYAFDDGCVLLANQGFVDIMDLRCRPEELIGRPIRQMLDYGVGEAAIRKRLIETGEIRHGEHHFQTLTGKEGWATFDAFLIDDPQSGGRVVEAIIRDITERKRREQELRASESDVRQIIEAIPQLVWTAHGDGNIYYCNARWCNYTGLTSEQATNNGWVQTLHPDDRARAVEAWTRAAATGSDFSFHARVRGTDGTYRWFWAMATPLRDERGEVIRWFGTCTDVDDQKRAEDDLQRAHDQLEHRVVQRTAELARERALLRTLIDHLPDYIFVKDAQGRFVLNNAAHLRVLGFQQQDEAIGRTDSDVFPPEVAGHFVEDERMVLEKGQPLLDRQEQFADRQGRVQWLLTTKIPLHDSNGNVTGLVGVSRNITPLKQATEALQRNERLLQQVLDSLPVAVWVVDTTGTILYGNPACRQIWGEVRYVGADQYGQYKAWFADTGKLVGARDWGVVRALEKGESALNEVINIECFDGSHKTIYNSSVPLCDSKGKVTGAIVVNEDITAQHRAEDQVRKLNADLASRATLLEAANKELEAFSYSVSHDLRAPLRAIDGFSRILLDDHFKDASSEAYRLLGVIRDNARQMGRLIEDLLRFSRLSRQPLQKEPVDVGRIVQDVLAELKGELAGRRIEIRVGEIPPAQADPALLKQVYLNLISNAIKYTRARPTAIVEIGSQQREGQVVYFVKDNGVGFDMNYVNKLFGVFQRLHRAEDYEGTGVGLAIVQRIVARHGGRVWAEGKVDGGAGFYFTLVEYCSVPEDNHPRHGVELR